MRRKNNFSYLFGPSDECGRIQVPAKELWARAEDERRAYLMDFADPSTEFSGTVKFAPVPLVQLAAAIKAYDVHSIGFPDAYPTGYREQLLRSVKMIETSLRGQTLKLAVEMTGGFQVKVEVAETVA